MSDVPQISVVGITGLPEIKEGDDLGSMIVQCAHRQGTPLARGDILVVTQKVVSKAEGRLVDLNTITPSAFAAEFASHSGRDARLVELVLRESRSVVRMDAERGIMITETKHGFVCANSGIDSSNVFGEDNVCLRSPVVKRESPATEALPEEHGIFLVRIAKKMGMTPTGFEPVLQE